MSASLPPTTVPAPAAMESNRPIAASTTDASAPTSPKPAKTKSKSKSNSKAKAKDTAQESADNDAFAPAPAPTSPTTSSKGKKNKLATLNNNAQSQGQLAEAHASADIPTANQDHPGPSAKASKRTKRTRKSSTSASGLGPIAAAPAVDLATPAVSIAHVVDVVDTSEQGPAEGAPKRKRDGLKKKGTKKKEGEAKGVAVDDREGGQGDGCLGSEQHLAPKRNRQRANSKPIKQSTAADADVPTDPVSSSAADILVASASAKALKNAKGLRSSNKASRKQESATIAIEDHDDTSADPVWAKTTKSDAEDEAQWQQPASSESAPPTRSVESHGRKSKSARKDANRKSGGLEAGVPVGAPQAQPEWTTSAKSDAEDESFWAHTNSDAAATGADLVDATSVATQTTAAPSKQYHVQQHHRRDQGRQQRQPGSAAATTAEQHQVHPSKSRDNWRRRPSNAGDGDQRRDSHQPVQRRTESGQQDGHGHGQEVGGRRRKNSENANNLRNQPQPRQRNQSGGHTRATSGSRQPAERAGQRQQRDARVDDVADKLQKVSLHDNKQDGKSATTKLEHSPPHSPTKPNPSIDIRKALGSDFQQHVKQIKESLSALDIQYADPSTWAEMYPEDVRFRPFYFQDQAIPIPADSAILFPPPWTPASWDQACEPPAHPVSMFTRLSLELFAFSEHVKMSPVDEFLRTCAYARLEAMVSRLLPDGCEMFVFGSSASPLSNPNSDLDVGIFPRNPNNLTLESGRQQARKILDTLFRYILVIAAPRSVESVFHAKVPLIKYTDRATGVEVDVSVQWEGGESVDIVYALAAKYPALVPMVRTVKSMLSLHALNSGRDGGIHGFCVLSMVAGFLGRLEAMGLGVGVKVTEREGKVYPPPHMHGLAFLAFLHFVGFVWDPATTGMDNTNGGALFYRHAKCDREYQNHILLVTSVRPQATPENVGRSVRAETWVAFRSICQNAFMRLYQCARTQIAPPAPGAPYGQAEQHGSSSLLGLFLTVPPMYRKAMEAAEAAIDTFSQYSKFEGVGDFNTWVEMVLSKERAYFRRKFEEVKEQMDRRGGGGRGGGNQGQGGRGGGARNQPQNRPNNAGQQQPKENQGQARNTPQHGPPARGQPTPRSRNSTREDTDQSQATLASAAAVNVDAVSHADGDGAHVIGEEETKKKRPKKAKKSKRDRERGPIGEGAATNETAEGEGEEGEVMDRVEQALDQLVLEDV